MLNKNKNKALVLKELEHIYKYVQKATNTNNLDDTEMLKRENIKLKNKIEIIDKKFEKVYSENNELREYMKEKTENMNSMQHVLQHFKVELDEMKREHKKTVSIDLNQQINSLNSSSQSFNKNAHNKPKVNLIPKLNFPKVKRHIKIFRNKKNIQDQEKRQLVLLNKMNLSKSLLMEKV